MVPLHANATTTPATRAYIQASDKPVADLAEKLNVTETTIRRWKDRTSTADRSHRPIKMQTSLSAEQEEIVVELRKTLLLAVDDLLVIVREFIYPKMSRSALIRLMKRHGVNQLRLLRPEPEEPTKAKGFKAYLPGFFHVDIKFLPQMADEDHHRYLYVAIDRATRYVYLEVLPNKEAVTAQGFMQRLIEHSPIVIEKLLTDNGKEFSDRFCRTGEREPTGRHLVDQVCQAHQIEHRLIPPGHPQTNGMVERFNGRITGELRARRFDSAAELAEAMLRYGYVYNHYLRQRAIEHRTPVEMLIEYYKTHPERFRYDPHNLPAPNNYPSSNLLGWGSICGS